MVRFMVQVGRIEGFYYDDQQEIAFNFILDICSGKFRADKRYSPIFSQIMQVITFVELGDIEVLMLESGKNNGKEKSKGKVTNTSNNTVYVVDSSWNKIIIRTTGFAVRGHFRLQPCGPGLIDRKLTWIDAFEKHGYKRRPKGEIVNN